METKEKTIWNEKLWQEVGSLDSLKDVRARAWSRFEETGFPTSKNEAWRYTAVKPVAEEKYVRPSAPKPNDKVIAYLQQQLYSFKHCARLIFVNGWLMPQISDLKPLGDAVDFASVKDLAVNRPAAIKLNPDDFQGFAAMNAALFQDGIWLNVREEARAQVPLLVYFLQTDQESKATTLQLRHWISLGKQSSLTLLEWHDTLTDQSAFKNHEMTISLAPDSTLQHARFQNAGLDSWLRSASQVVLSEKSVYDRFDFEAGARVSRNELTVQLGGEEAVCHLKGVAVGAKSQHFDTQVLMNHIVPNASSDQSYRNLLGGSSRSVFGGCVKVYPNAQKTDAQQVHKTLLMSRESRADTKPQLIIDADDVKCSHGAAIGQLSEDSLFYLQSRGINRSAAERMLAAGFVEALIDSISEESWRSMMKSALEIKLNRLFQS